MKELNVSSRVENIQTVESPKKYGHTRSLIAVPGHILWEFNIATGKLERATVVRKVAIGMNGKEKKSSVVMEKENCLYFFALNEKNAWKRLGKIIQSIKQKGGAK